jgi:integrase
MARKDGKDRGLFEKPTGSGTWWIEYHDQYGQRHRVKGGSKAQARQLYQRRKAEVAEGRHEPPAIRNQRITLGEAITEYIETTGKGKRSWRDDRNFAQLWTAALGKLPLEHIGPKEVERWKIEWGAGKAPGTVNRRLSFLRRVFNVQIRNGVKLTNPVTAVGLYKENNARQRYLTPDELVRLRKAFPAAWWHVVEFAMHTGLRQAEQFSLRWEFVDLQVRSLMVPRSKDGWASCTSFPSLIGNFEFCEPGVATGSWVGGTRSLSTSADGVHMSVSAKSLGRIDFAKQVRCRVQFLDCIRQLVSQSIPLELLW